jgi:hypothetical protein
VIRQNTLENGIVTGSIGFAAVALALAVLNIDAGRSPFYTAALLGSALFYHLTDPATLIVTAGPVFAYNALHLLVYLALGMLISWLVTLAERYPAALYLILFPLLFVAAHLFLALIIFAEPLLGAAGPLQIGLASVVAALAMGAFVWRTHPLLRHDLVDTPLGAVPGDD